MPDTRRVTFHTQAEADAFVQGIEYQGAGDVEGIEEIESDDALELGRFTVILKDEDEA
jgi:hypothetical protein